MHCDRRQLRHFYSCLTDSDSSGEIDYKEFAAWWKKEHSDEHPAGADCFTVKNRIDEMIQRKCLKRTESLLEGEKQYAGDRDFGIELVIMLFGRTVDLLQFKKVSVTSTGSFYAVIFNVLIVAWAGTVIKRGRDNMKVMNFFSNEERMVIYQRLGPLNALNPLEPDGRWSLTLGGKKSGYIKDENEVAHMLSLLAAGEPGENWLNEIFGLRRDKMRSFDLPLKWLEKVPEEGFLELVYFTSAHQVDVELRQSLFENVLVSEEVTNLSALPNPMTLIQKLKR
eukprot:SAG31_NODE_648_length_13204_cov_57.612908_10_plen_281_part_00